MKKAILAATAAFAAALSASVTFHVDAQAGDDSGGGSADRPFATLVRARSAIRALKHAGKFPSDGVTVELNGMFDMCSDGSAFVLDASDSGTPSAPIVWKAGPKGARLTGATCLSEADFSPVADEAVLRRLRPEARGKVYVCDLKKKGVEPLKPLPRQFAQWKAMELFVAGRDCTIARWPNSGWLEIPRVVDSGVGPLDRSKSEWAIGVRGAVFGYDGDEPARWDVSKGVYMKGFWYHDWLSETLRVAKIDAAKREITTEGIHRCGVAPVSKKKAKRRYYVYNLLEELDAPGEWYTDREERLLYFMPDERGFKDMFLSLRKTPLVSMKKANHIVLKNLEFVYPGQTAIIAEECRGVTMDSLSVVYSSQDGIKILKASDCLVTGCRITQSGGTGLELGGGDRKTLTAGANRVTRCEIDHSARLARIAGPCLRLHGCGNRVDHCYIHDTPYVAMIYNGNNHLIELNEIECAMMESGDGGGMYTGRDWGSQGNIVRWNHLHHFGADGVELRRSQGVDTGCEPLKKSVMVMGLYIDDCDSGDVVYGNIFHKAGWAMYCGGGRDNKWRCNICIDSTSAAELDMRGLRRARPGEGVKTGWDLLKKLQAMNWQNPPWSTAYPQLVNVMDEDPKLPVGSEFSNNVSIGCKAFFRMREDTMKFLKGRLACTCNVHVGATLPNEAEWFSQDDAANRGRITFVSSPGLEKLARESPLAVQDSPLFKAAKPNFPRIPVENIGLRGAEM